MASLGDITRVKLSDIRPYEKNAKIHGREQLEKLKASIQEFGFVNPCLIDRDHNLICMPSAVVVNVMGANHKRMHHRVQWANCVPEILSERWKK